ncbi:MAG: hypothetical protein HUU20_08245 [Pirellulales bacterium]|nr:hypothetical protein [Pirellulales bacterium]
MCIRVFIATVVIVAGLARPALPVIAQQPRAGPNTNQRTPEATAQLSGGGVLGHAIRLLETRGSISARVRQQIDLFGKQLVGAGTYLEQRSGASLRFRLELKIQLGDEASTLLEVCDGQYLWRYQRFHDEGKLSKIDVQRVLKVLEEAGQLGRLDTVDQWPALGGLARLLRGLYANFDFHQAEPLQLSGGGLGESPGTVPFLVWKLRGQWKPGKLADLLPDRAEDIRSGKPVDLAGLPSPLPEAVVIYLARDDLFPHRLEFYRSPPEKPGQGRGAPQPVVTIEFIQLNVNVPIDPSRFLYNPGNLDCLDQTADFLRKLGIEE